MPNNTLEDGLAFAAEPKVTRATRWRWVAIIIITILGIAFGIYAALKIEPIQAFWSGINLEKTPWWAWMLALLVVLVALTTGLRFTLLLKRFCIVNFISSCILLMFIIDKTPTLFGYESPQLLGSGDGSLLLQLVAKAFGL